MCHWGRPPWKVQVPQYVRHSRHRHKNLHNDHRCGRAFDASYNLQKHYGCYSRKGMSQEFLSTVPRVCWLGCKSDFTLIKQEDKKDFGIHFHSASQVKKVFSVKVSKVWSMQTGYSICRETTLSIRSGQTSQINGESQRTEVDVNQTPQLDAAG